MWVRTLEHTCVERSVEQYVIIHKCCDPTFLSQIYIEQGLERNLFFLSCLFELI